MLIDWLRKKMIPKDEFQPLTIKEVADSYRRPPSISEKLPWREYDKTNQCFLLEDGLSVAALFELEDVPSEARTENYLWQLQQALQGIFQDVFPPYFDEESPWIVQFYCQDDLSLKSFYQAIENYVKPSTKETQFTQTYLQLFKEHTEFMTRKEGIFLDNKVSGLVFRGKRRKIRAVIYRHLTSKSKLKRGRSPEQDLNAVAQSFISKLEASGVHVKRCNGQDFYDWMVKWFNPSPRHSAGNPDTLLEQCPYPSDDEMPFGYDFSRAFFFSVPQSDHDKGIWYFDQKPHKYLTITGLNKLPEMGHLVLERKFGNRHYGLFDKFPEGSIFVMTVIIQSQETVKDHVFRIEKSAKRATNTESIMALEDCQQAKRAIENSNYFFPTIMGVYLHGESLDDLYDKETEVMTLLSNNGLLYIDGDHELTPVDTYLRYLPMCYDFNFDKKYLLRSRYLSGMSLAKLLPLYGRERGTPHPGLAFYNRGGEPFTLDPFNPEDKDNNSHLLFLGSSGAGKSATAVSMLMHVMAIYRPRIVIVDAGNSFALLAEYFKSQGLSVNRVEVTLDNPPALNPFANSALMLAQIEAMDAKTFRETVEENEQELISQNQEATLDEKKGSSEKRDYMGEMALACQLMITGGEAKEEQNITRQDRMLIIDALIHAAKTARQEGRDQMIAQDVVNAFYQMADEIEGNNANHEKARRIRQMADSLSYFCKDLLSSQVFNRPGQSWPDADVTVFEMGIFKDEGYEAHRALSFMGCMNNTMSLAERNQYDERFTIFIGDEIHIILKIALTAVYLTKCSKMSRKYALWLWLLSQNVQDFPNDASKMLSMMEFWMCLGMSEAEMKEVERFKPLSEEERLLFRSVRKAAGKYVEGVLLCNRFKGLFRNIPPRLALALAMTEKSEKAERSRIMQQLNCSEIEAVKVVAEMMSQCK